MKVSYLAAGAALGVFAAVVGSDLRRAADEPREGSHSERTGVASHTSGDVLGEEGPTDVGTITRPRSAVDTGRTIFLDPETNTAVNPPPGGLPTPERVITTGTFVERVAEDGTVSVSLGEAFMIPLVASGDCRGTLRRHHQAQGDPIAPACDDEEAKR